MQYINSPKKKINNNFLMENIVVTLIDWYHIKLFFWLIHELFFYELMRSISILYEFNNNFLIQNIIVTLTDSYPNKLIIFFIWPIKLTNIK